MVENESHNLDEKKESKSFDIQKDSPIKKDILSEALSKTPQEVPSTQEYLYFRCANGHENYMPLTKEQTSMEFDKEELIVQCQKCHWQSLPFRPALFQHHGAGDVLLWVYTTKDTNAINSIYNISFESSTNIPQNTIVSNKDSSPNIEKKETSISSAGTSPKENISRQQKKHRSSDTIEIKMPSYNENLSEKDISKDFLEENKNNFTENDFITVEDLSSHLDDTVEIPQHKKEKNTQRTLASNTSDHNYYHYFPNELPPFKIPQPSFVPLVQTGLYILAFSIFSFLALHSCNEQTEKISQSIRSIQLQGNSPVPQITYIPTATTVAPEDQKREEVLAMQQRILQQKLQDLQKEIAQQNQNYSRLQENYKALNVSYETEQREKKDIQSQLEKINKEFSQIQSDYKQLTTTQQTIFQALHREFEIKQLDKSDQDFIEPMMDKTGKFLLFAQENQTGNSIQTQLNFSIYQDNELKILPIFKTSPIQANKRGIPFLYSWDGIRNIALVTRIDGENILYYINFQWTPTKGLEVLQNRKILSANHPEVIGAAQISNDGRMLSVIHKINNEIWVKVYSCEDGILKANTIGGGDTSRMPTWNPDNSKIYFLTNDRTGIVEWTLPKDKKIKQMGKEIYGRYIVLSPDGKRMAFFLQSEQGKGFVHFCIWNIEKNEISFLQKDILTTENCRPSWSPEGRFLAILQSGSQDQIVIYDTFTNQRYDVVQKTGKIKWLDWSNSSNLIFSYQEGLFNRPYSIQLLSWFSRN